MESAAQHAAASAITRESHATFRQLERETGFARRTLKDVVAAYSVPTIRVGLRWYRVNRTQLFAALATYACRVEPSKPRPPTERTVDPVVARVAAVRQKRAERAKAAEAKRPTRKTRGAARPEPPKRTGPP
jgi:hypothetical protein